MLWWALVPHVAPKGCANELRVLMIYGVASLTELEGVCDARAHKCLKYCEKSWQAIEDMSLWHGQFRAGEPRRCRTLKMLGVVLAIAL
jgi:hypothetical protein